MVRPINRNILSLGVKSPPATKAALTVGDALMATLMANIDGCVGMAANMIGVCKAIIVFFDGDNCMTMLNPEILRAEGAYETEEGCLSLLGAPRKTQRFRKIKVRFQTERFQTRIKTFEGFSAQIIQHEIDHIHGILI